MKHSITTTVLSMTALLLSLSPSVASASFINNGDGTVTDTSTGLMWQQTTSSWGNWATALAYCEDLTTGGYTDWRLPNIKELLTIFDLSRHDPAIDDTVFSLTNTLQYSPYSSTTVPDSPSLVYYVSHITGEVSRASKTPGVSGSKVARCVR